MRSQDSIIEDRPAGRPIVLIAAALHAGMAEAVVADLERLAESNGVNTVVLSDGVWQNELLLLNLVVDEIASRTLLDIEINALVPVSDGGISLGQAPIASRMAFR